MNILQIFNKGAVDEYRRAREGVHSDPNAAADASRENGARSDTGESADPGAGENPSIVLGEITAYRCWQTQGGVYQSLNGTLWFPDEPMSGEGISFDNSSGVYAFKTLSEARDNAKLYHRGQMAVGSVKMWGTVVEHKNGYRAEYAVIDKIIDSPVNGYSDLRSKIEVERTRDYEAAHTKDRSSYQFRCERYGDFLSVFIERNGDKLASALCLNGVATISPVEGKPPRRGPETFQIWNSGSSPSIYRIGMPDRHAMLQVHNQTPGSVGHVQFISSHGGPQPVQIQDCALPPIDDEIQFSGTHVSIYVPHGLGPGVYQKILNASAVAQS